MACRFALGRHDRNQTIIGGCNCIPIAGLRLVPRLIRPTFIYKTRYRIGIAFFYEQICILCAQDKSRLLRISSALYNR
jgi:hypothetical protein